MNERNNKIPLILLGGVLVLILASCNFPGRKSDVGDKDLLATLAQQTVAANLTQAISETQADSPLPSPTETDEGETSTPSVTSTPSQTPTPQATATSTPRPCNQLDFIEDITYPDDTEVVAGTTFTKTWRLQNIGTCSWSSGYDLVFNQGDRMGAPDSVPVTSGTVAPGEMVDVSVELTAPDDPGTYQGFFLLRSADNVVFGLGGSGGDSFWVKVKVVAPTDTPTPTPTSTFTITLTPTLTPTPTLSEVPTEKANPD